MESQIFGISNHVDPAVLGTELGTESMVRDWANERVAETAAQTYFPPTLQIREVALI